MTKTESPYDVAVDELPPWDDTETREQDELQHAGDLTPYSYDSEQRTLVGLGPLSRARRSRPTAAAPDSERMPLSEPPGPFIADDEEEPLATTRGRKLGKRAVAVSLALLAPLAAVGFVRHLSSSATLPSQSPHVAAAQPPPSPPSPAPETPQASQAPVVAAAEAQSEPPTAEAADAGSAEDAKERSRPAPSAERAKNDPSPLPVKLAELPEAPAIVDRSNGDTNAGTIQVMSNPPASVVLDGRPLGKAPRVVRATTGSHTLVFIHPLYGRRSLNVNVRPGAATTAAANF